MTAWSQSSKNLIIELDGDSHGDYYRIEEDEQRDKDLFSQGFKILRFENRFVYQDIEWVKKEILKASKETTPSR